MKNGAKPRPRNFPSSLPLEQGHHVLGYGIGPMITTRVHMLWIAESMSVVGHLVDHGRHAAFAVQTQAGTKRSRRRSWRQTDGGKPIEGGKLTE